ncbi:hypothetical protein vseg_013535 [Gypsophila vaccaria]
MRMRALILTSSIDAEGLCVALTTVDLEHYDLPFDDFFADVPYSLDVPLGLALDEEFNLNDEAPAFLNDPVHDAVAKGFTSGGGKKSNVIKSSFVTDPAGSMGKKRNEVAMSPSNSQRYVDGPHSVEVAAKSFLDNQIKPFEHVVSHPLARGVPAPSELTVMPETAVKGILHTGLMTATIGLLRTMKDAAFDNVEKIAKEASFVYRCVKTLKGNLARLQEKIESYAAVVKAFRLLEIAANSHHRGEEIVRAIILGPEGLGQDELILAANDKECAVIAEKKLSVQKKKSELEDRLKKACEQYGQLEKDADIIEKSRDALRDKVNARSKKIADLEVVPKLSTDDMVVLEEQKRSVLELQFTLDPDNWFELVS